MTVCLYEYLKAAGLQRHYARFTLVGVCHAAHLSALRIEDYPLLGISSMEDRTRLFHLVKMVKTLDLKSLTNDDMIYHGNNNGDNEAYSAVDGRLSSDRNPDGDVSEDQDENVAFMDSSNASSFVRSKSACRWLDFNVESPHPVHISASHNRNDEPVQEKQSATAMKLELLSRNAVLYGHQKSKNNKLDVVSCSCDCHDEENLRRGSSVFNSDVNFMPITKISHKPNSNPATGTLKTFNSKLFGRKNREGISRKKNLSADTTKLIPVYVAKRTAGYNYGHPLSSPHSPGNKHVGGRRISVCVRKRPLTRAECRRGEADVVMTPGRDCVIVHEDKEAVDLTEYILQHQFYFDQVFGKESSNEEVYQKTAYPLVQHMLNGGKATCFAYGQTGAGKTHTMLGSSPGGPGLYALAVRDIFAHLSATHTYSSLLVYVSFFEIYCGQLYDLLDNRKRLFAREDGQKVVHISGLRNVRVDSVNSLLKVISQGTAERTQGMSGMNPHSSRSHALLQIQLRYSNQQTSGSMWFVDLAGSERASDTKEPDRQTRMEGAEINQSLLALKECIRSLDKEESHTPFRQSKLTQVLKDSFVGDSMTCMIANISPGHHATEHTLNTLRYADRVKELKGQGGRKYKMGPSSKHNMSNSNRSRSSVGAPKKTANQRETSEPNTPASRLHAFLCSTPKNSRCGEETRSRGREEMGLEHVTPVRMTKDDAGSWSKKADEREGRRMENEGFNIHYVREKSTRAVPVVRRKTFERKQKVQTTKRESGFHLSEKENPQHLRKETEWMETRKQDESNEDVNSYAEQQRERYLQKVDNKEKVRHLRQYHQQLQQFTPSLTSSSVHLLSSPTCLSSSYSTQDSLSSLLDSSRLLFFTNKDHSLEETQYAFRSRVEVDVDHDRRQVSLFGGETRVQSETSTNHYKNNDTDAFRSINSVGENQRLDECESERKRLSEESVRTVDKRLPRRKRMPCAWVEETEVESANSMPRSIPTHVEARLSYSCDLEDRRGMSMVGLNASDAPDKGVWTTDYFDSQHQRAPAERPLSPSCNALLTSDKLTEFSLESKNAKCVGNIHISPLQNTLEAVSSNSHKERKMFFLANARKKTSSHAQSAVTSTRTGCIKPTDCPVYTHSCNHTDLKAQIYASPQDESNVDSFSYVMDPLSTSLLHVDQQAASASFLQGNNKGEECLSGEKAEEEFVENEDTELSLSLINIPHAKIFHPVSSDNVTETEQQTYTEKTISGIGANKPLIPGFPLQKSRPSSNYKTRASSLQPSVPVLTPLMHTENNSSPAAHNPTECSHNEKSSSITTPQFRVSDHLGHSNHSSNAKVLLKPKNATEPSGREDNNQQIIPTMHFFTTNSLEHVKWCVVEAHLEQLKQMEALCHKEGKLLWQQHDMAFGEYVHKLAEILEGKARCLHSMRAQLQPYLKSSQSSTQGDDNHDAVMSNK